MQQSETEFEFERSSALHETIPELTKWLYKKSAGITHRFKHSSRSSITDTLTGNGAKMNLEKAIRDNGDGTNIPIKEEYPELSALRAKWKSFVPTKQSLDKAFQQMQENIAACEFRASTEAVFETSTATAKAASDSLQAFIKISRTIGFKIDAVQGSDNKQVEELAKMLDEHIMQATSHQEGSKALNKKMKLDLSRGYTLKKE